METIKNDLLRKIKGRKILGISFCDAEKMLQPNRKTAEDGLKGARIQDIERRGKLLIFHLDNGKKLLVHLKLTGRLLVRQKGAPLDERQHITLRLSDGLELRFADLRKFGFMRLAPAAELQTELQNFGPEPLAKNFTTAQLGEILQKKSGKIKQVLMDQNVIAGIGNIYSDEILWEAKISPLRSAKTLNNKEIRALHGAMREILKKAIEKRGTTTADEAFRDTAGEKGGYGPQIKAYQRAGQSCPRCKTSIKKFKFGSRSGHYCPRCQK